MFGALIGAGASLLGGILGKKADKKAQDQQNWYNDPQQMRDRAEAAGFNPLLWAGQGNIQPNAVASGAAFGNSIANAGLAIQTGMSEKKQLELEKTRLKQDKQRLDKLLEQATIRPKSGGLYAGNVMQPRNGKPVVGASTAAAASGVQPESRHVNEVVTTSSGETLTVPLGPDLDEWVTGVVLEGAGALKSGYKDARDNGIFSPIKKAGKAVDSFVLKEADAWLPKKTEAQKRAEAKEKAARRKRAAEEKANPRINFPSYLPSISN